jgi:hypothetical protein
MDPLGAHIEGDQRILQVGSLEDLVCQIAELQALQATWLIAGIDI